MPRGVWDTGVDPHLNSRLSEILLKQRGDSCFFVEAQPGMLFDAAEKFLELQNLKKSYRHARTALWISFTALVLSAISMMLNLWWSR